MRKKKIDKKGERWTDEEKEYLEKTWGNVSLLTMKKHKGKRK